MNDCIWAKKGIRIKQLGQSDCAAYGQFIGQLWPNHCGAGSWESIQAKYYLNPLAAVCPGAGLYGCYINEQLCGIMGAAPSPVSLQGELHPGHMLVDWSVPRAFQSTPAAGLLFSHLMALPGLKLASSGTKDSQDALMRRGTRIPATDAIVNLRLVDSFLLQTLCLGNYKQPLPIHNDEIPYSQYIRPIDWSSLTVSETLDAESNFIHRSWDYWKHLCKWRWITGGIGLQINISGVAAVVVIGLYQVGKFRIAELQLLQTESRDKDEIQLIAHSVRRFLSQLKTAWLRVTISDPVAQSFASEMGWSQTRQDNHWWHLKKATDPNSISHQHWRMSHADRDSFWGRSMNYCWRKL